MDFETPSINQIAEFFLYLFQERKLQPSIIVGYRTAIADKVGNYSVEIIKDQVSTEIGPRVTCRDIPSWNLSLVLHQLTNAPFEPLR